RPPVARNRGGARSCNPRCKSSVSPPSGGREPGRGGPSAANGGAPAARILVRNCLLRQCVSALARAVVSPGPVHRGACANSSAIGKPPYRRLRHVPRQCVITAASGPHETNGGKRNGQQVFES